QQYRWIAGHLKLVRGSVVCTARLDSFVINARVSIYLYSDNNLRRTAKSHQPFLGPVWMSKFKTHDGFSLRLRELNSGLWVSLSVMSRGRSMPPKSSPRSPSKRDRMQALTRKIVERLQEIRSAYGLSNSAHRPALQPGETLRAVHIYSGASQNVNGPTHRYYDRLGRIFFVVSRGNGPGTIRIIWDDTTLPREILEADLELNQMLQQRWNISRENRRARSVPASTPATNTRTFPPNSVTRGRIAPQAEVQASSASSPSSAMPPLMSAASVFRSRRGRPAGIAVQAAPGSPPSLVNNVASSPSSAALPPSPTASATRRRVSEWAVQVLPAAILSALPTGSRALASSESA
ncbi:hypothetical protein F5880DRAFT_1512682, partial [Lentinula raphanica]